MILYRYLDTGTVYRYTYEWETGCVHSTDNLDLAMDLDLIRP